MEDKQEYDVDDIDTSQVVAEDPFMNVDQQLSIYPSGMIHVTAENTRCLLTNQIRLRCNFKPEKGALYVIRFKSKFLFENVFVILMQTDTMREVVCTYIFRIPCKKLR